MNRHELLKNMAKFCILKGDFVLNGGARSDVYFDKYQVTTNPHTLATAVEQLTNLLFTTDDAYLEQLIAPELGGAVFATALQQHLLAEYETSVELNIVRSEYKTHGTGEVTLGKFSTSYTSVLVDDVITTGKAVLDTIDVVRKKNPNIRFSQIIALVNRGNEGVTKLRNRGYSVSTVFDFSEIIQRQLRPDLYDR
jgi:uridine monophosphate synthetase